MNMLLKYNVHFIFSLVKIFKKNIFTPPETDFDIDLLQCTLEIPTPIIFFICKKRSSVGMHFLS